MLTDTIKCGDVSGVQSHNPTIARTIDRRSRRLIVRSIVGCQDWSAIVAESHNWSYDRSPSATIDRTIDRRVLRLIYDRSQDSRIDRTIDRLWLPLVVRFPTMDHAIDLLQSLFVARPRVRPIVRWPTTSQKTDRSMRPPLLEIVANIADRSHVRQSATNRTIRCDCGFR